MDQVNLVMSITGAKYTRDQITAAIQACDNDPDDAIEYLLAQSKSDMFSARAVEGEKVKKYVKEVKPKPANLELAESLLQGKSHFDRLLELQNCLPSDDHTQIIEEAKNVFESSTSKEYCIIHSRLEREKLGLDKVKVGGGLGLINLIEQRANKPV